MYRVVKFSDGAYFMFGNGDDTSCSCESRSRCRKYRGLKGRRRAFMDATRWGGKVYRVVAAYELQYAIDSLRRLIGECGSVLASDEIERSIRRLKRRKATSSKVRG